MTPDLLIVTFNPEVFVLVLAGFISLLFKYFPALNTWYAGKATEVKSGIMIGLMVLLGITITLLAHFGVIATDLPVTPARFILTMYFAVSSNQFTYLIFPEPRAVRVAKEVSLERPGNC